MNDPAYGQRKLDLIAEITAAFDGVTREGGVSQSEAWVIDDYGVDADEERAAARKKDTETRWQDVADEDISAGYVCLTFFDDVGFRYYSPAYMLWYLRTIDSEEWAGSNTYDSLLHAFGAIRNDEFREFMMSSFKLFTLAQYKAVAHFLEFVAERNAEAMTRWEETGRGNMAAKGHSQAEIDSHFEEWYESYNGAKIALNWHWGQFL